MTAGRFAAELLAGPARRGRGLGHGYLLFGDDVLALTPPGAPRLPNGIETDVHVELGEEVVVGGGVLRTPGGDVSAAVRWDARPSPRALVALDAVVPVDPPTLVGWGPGLTPLGDDILVGYVAGRVLAGRRPPFVSAATTALSRTLLACAARGELPEPAHALLEDGDATPLLEWGATSGKGLLVGLGAASGVIARRAGFHLELPLPGGPRTIGLSLERIPSAGRAPVRGPAPPFEPPLYGSCSSAGSRS